jgi:DNA-binding response OmpR family regulator
LAATDGTAPVIFIAEDNPILLQGLGRALSANGYEVQTAEDGAAVMTLLSESRRAPDLLLLDVMMPGMSGLDVLRAVRGDTRWTGVPVVLITAATDEALPGSAMREGAVDVMIKPFRLGDLLERVARQVQVKESSAGSAPVVA